MTTLRWERGTRYYEAHLVNDLLGDWIVTRVWGPRGERQGRVAHTLCNSYASAWRLLMAIGHRREAHGYRRL